MLNVAPYKQKIECLDAFHQFYGYFRGRMRFEQLDLNLLVALDILLEERNITRTADKLHLSQSATSSILSRLRQYFDDDLLVQIGRKMQPTPYALELHEPVKAMLNIVRGSITNKRKFDPATSTRHFRIVASDYIIQVFLTPVLAKIQRLAPSMTFEFLSPFAVEMETMVKSGIDIVITPENVRVESYPYSDFSEDELVCIASKDNPHTTNGLTQEIFSALGHVSVGFSRASQLSVERWLVDEQHIERKVEVITNDFSSLCISVLNTDRLAVIPRRFAESIAKLLPLDILSLPFNFPDLKEVIMWHPTLDSDPVHRWLRGIMQDEAKYINR